MAGKSKILFFSLLALTLFSASSTAQRNRQEAPAPQIYTEKAKALLNSLAAKEQQQKISPYTKEQQEEIRRLLRDQDAFKFDSPSTLQISNPRFNIPARNRDVIQIKLGHTYNTSIVFTDSMGNPWSVETLTDMSNTSVVSFKKVAPHIITVKPQKKSGETNLPIKLAGEQYPMMLYFDINEEEVFFNVDVKVDALGDHPSSQQSLSMIRYQGGEAVIPKLSEEPEKELMLQAITPEGYARRTLLDDYGDRQDIRDFIAWTFNGKLYILTPHFHYTPDPVDVSAASDGRHRLFEFDERPVILMRKNNKTVMLHVK